MRWVRKRGDRVRITSRNYTGHTEIVASNVYQKTVEYPGEFADGCHFMLGNEELVTVQWERLELTQT